MELPLRRYIFATVGCEYCKLKLLEIIIVRDIICHVVGELQYMHSEKGY